MRQVYYYVYLFLSDLYYNLYSMIRFKSSILKYVSTIITDVKVICRLLKKFKRVSESSQGKTRNIVKLAIKLQLNAIYIQLLFRDT